jgi:membrane protein
LQETFTGWSDDRGFRFAAALAYYAVFSITPLLIICISLAGFVFGEGQARTEILDQFGRLFGPKAATEIETLIVASANQARSGWATLIGIVTLLLGASAVFAQLKDALNTIWGVRLRSSTAHREFVRDYLVSFAMVLAIGFLLTISLVLTTALQAVVQHMSWLLPKPALTSVFAELCSFLLLACLFGLIYKVLPDVELEWRDVRMGALVTGFLFTAGKYAISFYLASSSVVSSFGAAGALILLLLWIYYSAVIFFFGAEFTKTYSRHCRGGIQPEAHATFVTREMKVEQGVDKHS